MQVNITARHLELTQALADYVQKKVERCERYLEHLVWAQVILSVEKYRQEAEIVIHAARITFRSKEESLDLYAAIDLAVDKIEKQLKKHKEKTKINRKAKLAVSIQKKIPLSPEKTVPYEELIADQNMITEVRRFDMKPMSFRDAVREMDLLKYKFYMYMSAETRKISVIYRRDNGSLGLIEPDM